MMPQLITVRVRRAAARPIRLWIPLLPVVLVLSPLLILALVVTVVVAAAYRVNPVRALGTLWRLLCALPGTQVDVEQGQSAVFVNIR